MKLYFAFLIVLMFSTLQACSNSGTGPDKKTESEKWLLTWQDEFNDSQIDMSKWTYDTGGHGFGNNEWQYYTNRSQNSFIDDTCLVIEARRESFEGSDYTSARLKTQSLAQWQYGKFEIRAKLPQGQGIWPAIWMLGSNISTVGWPACGEIDIMEMIGGSGRENTVHGTIHWKSENDEHAQFGSPFALSSGRFSDKFYTYAIEWSDQKIEWFINGIKYLEADITPAALSEFHHGFFMILNVAVGGNWPGYPDGTTVFPQRMYVDYVRVYKLNPDYTGDSE
ncbi:MAG: glycoside hydrolase family 16 protein [Calditrichaeota bacterium]|nr:glycoside hydrolase family 16 protein [Calditrichota bacterium]